MAALRIVGVLCLLGVVAEFQAYSTEAPRLHGFGFGLLVGALESIRLVLIWHFANEEQRQRAQTLIRQGLMYALLICVSLWGAVVPFLPSEGRNPIIIGQAGNLFVGISTALWVVVSYLTPPKQRRRWRLPVLAKSTF
jgi:cytochrome b561